jgi:hypothetical protein
MTPSFITTIRDAGVFMNWDAIVIHQRLNEQFIRDNLNKLNIELVLKFQTLSESFKAELQSMLDQQKEENAETEESEKDSSSEEDGEN